MRAAARAITLARRDRVLAAAIRERRTLYRGERAFTEEDDGDRPARAPGALR